MSSAPDASNTAAAQQGLGAMTVRGAVFLGVGSMVGARFGLRRMLPV